MGGTPPVLAGGGSSKSGDVCLLLGCGLPRGRAAALHSPASHAAARGGFLWSNHGN